MSLNSIAIYGTLTRDPEAETLPNGTALTKFSIAVNEKFTTNGESREKVFYFDVTVWGKQAESVAKYLAKGRHVNVQGRLQQDRWEKDGQKRSKVYIVASDVQFLSDGKSRERSEGGSSRDEGTYGGGGGSSAPSGGAYGGGGNLQPVPEDDSEIPF